jgi:hypothetical protein
VRRRNQPITPAPQKVRMGQSATVTFTKNHDCVAPAGILSTVRSLSHQATGYRVRVSSSSRTPILRKHRVEPGDDQHNVGWPGGGGRRGPLTLAELHGAAALAPPRPARRGGYPAADPELCGGAPARSPARANRRAWGRAQCSPPPATTVPPVESCPPRKSPPAVRGPSCDYGWSGTVRREWQALDRNGWPPFSLSKRQD